MKRTPKKKTLNWNSTDDKTKFGNGKGTGDTGRGGEGLPPSLDLVVVLREGREDGGKVEQKRVFLF